MGDASVTVESVVVRRLQVPLKAPYKLSLGAVTRFDTILVRVDAPAGSGWGDATILTGYTDETVEGAWALARELAARLPGMSAARARQHLAGHYASAPFTATAFATALDMLQADPALQVTEATGVPLLATLGADGGPELAAEIERHLAQGYRTLKMKVGFDVAQDLARVAEVQRCVGGRAQIRIDANQGFSQAEACRFVGAVDPRDIELIEQPCAAEDWHAAEAVARVSNAPLMLDESIYDESDIERAAAIGARYVKLKLMKLGDVQRLGNALQRVRSLGMEPVLGNGVATEIGCWMEACVARSHIRNAGEMNGFLKQSAPLVRRPLRVEGGMLWLEPEPPRLDEAALARVSVEQAHFGKVPSSQGVV